MTNEFFRSRLYNMYYNLAYDIEGDKWPVNKNFNSKFDQKVRNLSLKHYMNCLRELEKLELYPC